MGEPAEIDAGIPPGPPAVADIELEYPVAAWSDRVKEAGKCTEYASYILTCG
jgi:hypothetical protein